MAYQRQEQKFMSRGVNVARPPDLLENAQPFILNMRALQFGALASRSGMLKVNAAAFGDLNIHSIIRLNNDLPFASQTFARFLGSGNKLYSDNAAHTVFTQRATGFNGSPLQFVVMRPVQSPEPWLYVNNATRSCKARVNGTVFDTGIAPPSIPPYAQPNTTSIKVVDDMEAVGTWANGGTAGAITAPSRIATTIDRIVWDAGTTGWATVAPVALDEAIQPGMRLIVNSGGGTAETVLVECVADAVTATTIAAILYDTGTTGACTIQLAAPSDHLNRDHMLRINSGGGTDEVVRVLSVTRGLGGLPSFRCVTVNNHVATETITGLRSFRAVFASTHIAGETLASNNLRTSITTGIGYITLVVALDLSTVNSRPISPDDYIHISIKLDQLELLTEGRIAFDIDSTTNDFTQNYLWKAFRTNDLTPATTGTITTLAAEQRQLQREQIAQAQHDRLLEEQRLRQTFRHTRDFYDQQVDPIYSDISPTDAPTYDEPIDQTTTGASQWTELRFKVSELRRVGSDTSRNLHDVAAIRIQLQTTGTVQLDVDAWWIGGTFGPDINVGAPYNYRYVYRSSLTGAVSNPSPPMRTGINAKRQRVQGTVTASADAQVDKIDIYRTGGTLITSDNSPPWFYVMSVLNSAPTFTDDFADDVVIRNRQLDFDNWQPFLDRDIPRSGTCTTIGTDVLHVGGTDVFDTAWPAGTIILINSAPYSLYASPSTTGKLTLNESAGNQTVVNWEIIAPRLQARPMPAMWGPFGGGTFEPISFACGSLRQPGHVFWTRPGNPDANSQYGSLELTSPSEPLINGCVFRSQAFVFSSEALYVLTPTIINGELRFSGAKVAGSRGLFSRYALTVGDEGIFYLSKDGIYLTAGGESISLTDEMLYPLFPHEGVVASPSATVGGPIFTQPNDLRLSHGASELYFDFVNTKNNDYATLLYDIKLKGWFYYEYSPEVIYHYFEEGRGTNTMLMGSVDGILYLSSGSTDDGAAIPCEVWTARLDGGDPRSNKQWANGMLDYAGTVNVTVLADNETIALGTLSLLTTMGREQRILDFQQAIHRNLQMRITGDSPLALYGFSNEWTRVGVSELTEQRNAYATQLMFPEYGHCYYLYLAHISNSDITLTVVVDNGTPNNYPIPTSGGLFRKDWVMLQAIKGKLFDFTFTSDEEFDINVAQTIIKAKPWKGASYEDVHPFGDTT